MDDSTRSPRARRLGVAATTAIVVAAVTIAWATEREADEASEATTGAARVAVEGTTPTPPTHSPPEIGDGRATRAPTTTTTTVGSTSSTAAPTTAPAGTAPPTDGPVATTAPPRPPTSSIPPSSTAAPSTTPSTTTTPTTTAPTTTAPTTTAGPQVPGALTQAYLGSQGESTASWLLPVTSATRFASLPNYDTDVDDDPGRTIRRTSGDSVTKDQAQLWAVAMPEAGRLTATPSLEIWVAAVGFDPAATASVEAGVAVCRGYVTTCDDLATAIGTFQQADYGEGFGRLVIPLPPIDHHLEAGELLTFGVVVPASSGSDVWLAFDTGAHPSRVRFD